jgi:excinuclease UvrABC ATPase subunit
MKYTIKPGSIAAVQYVESEDNRRWTAVYLAEGKQPEITGVSGSGKSTLPMPVLAAINRNFGMMFSVPVERRQALIDATVPQTIDTEE